ncbi:HNH endonuclease [Paracidovorax citrulli]|uniref:HNH nuclease domain-containing protein n=2 Tax=Paracidovorax citrulli TaxID=80869 RepID=A1TN25_PARC0|nr:HNH endonuclease [Paracidovorax citrulli]ABM32363.1 conserved hypothetical protein [Paracidovorax citrulli AAC00-1]ATG94617.1 HNH endonuclease [Paracidovorax citrulli]MVT28506.1 HNH endonuclease [Paracidovorax citrulli]MVT38645.1 HNH endonuclease [Paracidovorax citrulli]PVY66578.1 HNH endonuclease [Paracidovorax citrulli]
MNELTAEAVRAALDYDPQTGRFTRRTRTAQCHRIGDAADMRGHGNLAGYLVVSLGGKKWLAHRLAWLHVHGVWPQHEIDHINGDPSDNRIANLRDVRTVVNAQNKRQARVDSRSGLLGAALCKQSGKFRARIQVAKKFVHIGMFATAEEAHAAYMDAKRKLHPGFAA